jgi:tetratricopeptide (TPR) repeat protein
MSSNDALALLTKTVSGATVQPNHIHSRSHEDKVGLPIVQTLGCLALAIVQAGAYIRETSCSLNDYLKLYRRRQKEVFTYVPQHLRTDYRHSVYTTWQVSLDQIESMHNDASQHALKLLHLLCFYHHEHVPMQMFFHAWQNSRGGSHQLEALLWPGAELDFLDYRRALQTAISLLALFSLVTRDADTSLSMYPLVHEWCREKLAQREGHISGQRACSMLAISIPWRFRTEDYGFRRLLVPYIQVALRYCVHKGTELDEVTATELFMMALVLGENGSKREAVLLLEQVIALQKSKLGVDHPDTLRSIHSLANRYSEAGRQAEALQMTEEVVALHKSKLGVDHPDTLRPMHSLANRYSEAGRQAETLQMTEEVVALHKSKLGVDHPDTLRPMHSLANRYSETGRRAEALQLTEKVVALRKSKLGADHPDTLMSIQLCAYISINRERRL